MTITIIPRADWGARSARHRNTIPTPTPELWLHHTVGNERGASGMRAIQNFHMDGRGWSDIAYSFVVDRIDLKVYEGRGAGIAGGHTRGHNRISHAICVMGNFERLIPQDDLLDLLAELVAHGHGKGWWPAQFTGGHRDASGATTVCPGANLWRRIPDINRLALNQEPTVPDTFIARVNAAAVATGYTSTGDLTRLAANVEDMATGIANLLDTRDSLQSALTDARNANETLAAKNSDLEDLLRRSQADQDLAAAVRALVKAEQ